MLFHCKTPKTKQFQGFMLMRKTSDFLAPTDPDDTLAYLSSFAKFTLIPCCMIFANLCTV